MEDDAVENGPPMPGIGPAVKVLSERRTTMLIRGRRAEATRTCRGLVQVRGRVAGYRFVDGAQRGRRGYAHMRKRHGPVASAPILERYQPPPRPLVLVRLAQRSIPGMNSINTKAEPTSFASPASNVKTPGRCPRRSQQAMASISTRNPCEESGVDPRSWTRATQWVLSSN